MMEYMTDEELLKLISDVEEKDLVQAPPWIEDAVLERIGKKEKIIEYRRFRNRVMIAVASILVITAFIPESMSLLPKCFVAGDEYVEGTNTYQIGEMRTLSEIVNGHYISDLLNGREE